MPLILFFLKRNWKIIAAAVAIVSLMAGLLLWRSSLINQRKYGFAADEALRSKWAKQTPNRAKRVTDLIRYA